VSIPTRFPAESTTPTLWKPLRAIRDMASKRQASSGSDTRAFVMHSPSSSSDGLMSVSDTMRLRSLTVKIPFGIFSSVTTTQVTFACCIRVEASLTVAPAGQSVGGRLQICPIGIRYMPSSFCSALPVISPPDQPILTFVSAGPPPNMKTC